MFKSFKNLDFFNIFFILFCIFCYSKEVFLFDEELIIVTCLFIVFVILKNILSNSLKNFFDEKIENLRSIYLDKFNLELEKAEFFKYKLQILELTLLRFSFLFIRLKANLYFFFSLNFFFTFIFFKMIFNDILFFFFNEEKAFPKKLKLNRSSFIFNKFMQHRFFTSLKDFKSSFFFNLDFLQNYKKIFPFLFNNWNKRLKKPSNSFFLFKNSSSLLSISNNNSLNNYSKNLYSFESINNVIFLFFQRFFFEKNKNKFLTFFYFYFFSFSKNHFLYELVNEKRKKTNIFKPSIFGFSFFIFIENKLVFKNIINNLL